MDMVDIKEVQKKYGMVGESTAMQQVVGKVIQVAPTDITVLLQGESGVGKDVAARAIHGLSRRTEGNLVIVNCGAIPEGIIESELFGHEKGAFTGAEHAREGYFEKANGGTIFLDEIGDTPKNVQVKLLRVLENGEFMRVGSSQVRTTDVRVVAATNKDLWELVKEGEFREDLYYRLDTVTIKLPPLRERQEDILLIFRKFVSDFAREYDSVFRGFSDEARELLTSYRWPGNIRELRNVAEQLVVLEKSQFITPEVLQKYLKGRQSKGMPDNLPAVYSEQEQNHHEKNTNELVYRALIDMRAEISDLKNMLARFIYSTMNRGTLPKMLGDGSGTYDVHNSQDVSPAPGDHYEVPLGVQHQASNNDIDDDEEAFRQFFTGDDLPSLEETEKFLIQRALEKYRGNRRKASEVLGMSERTLYRKLDQYDLV